MMLEIKKLSQKSWSIFLRLDWPLFLNNAQQSRGWHLQGYDRSLTWKLIIVQLFVRFIFFPSHRNTKVFQLSLMCNGLRLSFSSQPQMDPKVIFQINFLSYFLYLHCFLFSFFFWFCEIYKITLVRLWYGCTKKIVTTTTILT